MEVKYPPGHVLATDRNKLSIRLEHPSIDPISGGSAWEPK